MLFLGLKLISGRLPLAYYKIKKQFGSVPHRQLNAEVRHPASPACGAGQSCRVDKVDKELSWQTWHRQIRQRCLLTWTVIKYGVMQPLAKKLHQSSQECSLRQKCALICRSGPFPLHSNNCYAWLWSISDNQASANLECCWTIQVFFSLLTGSCLLKAYHSYLRLLVELTSLLWVPALVDDHGSDISFFLAEMLY